MGHGGRRPVVEPGGVCAGETPQGEVTISRPTKAAKKELELARAKHEKDHAYDPRVVVTAESTREPPRNVAVALTAPGCGTSRVRASSRSARGRGKRPKYH